MRNPELAINKTYDIDTLAGELSTYENNDFDTSINMDIIKTCLNALFPSSRCVRVLYTLNTDKLFFGIKVMPLVEPVRVYNLIQNNDNGDDYSISSYAVEFDSKIFDNTMMLTGHELASMLIYSVYHTVFENHFENIIYSIERYEFMSGALIPLTAKMRLKELLAFAVRASLTKDGSPFIKETSEDVTESPILKIFNLQDSADRALRKIATSIDYVRFTQDPRHLAMSWVLRLLDNYDNYRLHGYKTLIRASDFTGSVLEREELLKAAEFLTKLDTIDESYIEPVIRDISIKDIKNKLYEITMLYKTLPLGECKLSDLHRTFGELRQSVVQLQHYLETHRCDEKMVNEINDLLLEHYGMMQNIVDMEDRLNRGESRLECSFIFE